MNSVYNTILKNNLFNKGEIIGVACSGGSDSISLLHYLNKNKDKFKIADVCAINVNHLIRTESTEDTKFVESFCKKYSIKLYKTEIDCLKLKSENNQSSLENVARKARYSYFDSLLKDKKVDKICLAHHQSDQAETILLNILRGAGINGASGMAIKNNSYVRPMLYTTKEEILNYLKDNNLDYVVDNSNFDVNYTRNFLRQLVIPLLETKFPKVQKNICAFGEKCRIDNNYITSCIPDDIIYGDDFVKIPQSYFENLNQSILNRIIVNSFKYLNSQIDMELKHFNIVCDIGKNNLKKSDLPNDLICENEGDYVSIYKKVECKNEYPFKIGKINFNNICDIEVLKSNCENFVNKYAIKKFDLDKIPQNAIWRTRKNGDIFHKVNGKKQKLKDFLIERKIPLRNRDLLPVLVCDNEVYVVANIEISDKIKIDSQSEKIVEINVNKNFKE